jgi:diaminohydroxyphosphoribosylaminopyrimidine deaminase/5-amino-6-(5-phosphoribosylamino)uracil reductase
LIQAGVARVVAPVTDPNPLVAGQGFARLRDAGIEVEIPSEFAAEAEKLNEPFLHFMRTERPLVTLKTAITLDGKISRQFLYHFLCRGCHIGEVVHVSQQNQESVSADASHRILFASASLKPFSHILEQKVPEGVPQRIINDFEPVKI